MKTYGDLLNKLSEYYDKTYNSVQSEEIQKYLADRNFPHMAIENLFNLVTENESFLPKKNKFKDIIDQALKGGHLSIDSGLHPESPLQQLHRAEGWPVEKILDNCRRIRLKQNHAGTDKLLSKEISFLVIWEQLKDVEPEHRELAKKRIVANGNNQLSKSVDLSDLSIYHKSQERDFERKGNVNMQGALEDII